MSKTNNLELDDFVFVSVKRNRRKGKPAKKILPNKLEQEEEVIHVDKDAAIR